MKKTVALMLAALLIACVPALAIAEGDRDIAIHEVYIDNLHAPVAGHCPEDSYFMSAEEGNGYMIVYCYWHDFTEGHDQFDESIPFVSSHTYGEGCMMYIEDGYYLADDCVFYFNGLTGYLADGYPMDHQYFTSSIYVLSAPLTCLPTNALFGDVDMNGMVESADALIALRCAQGIVNLTPEQLTLADIDRNVCNSSDALLILRYALGMIQSF